MRDEVARVADAMSARAPGARWVPRENLHVTLRFLGETDLGGDVAAALGHAAGAVPRFEVALSEAGAFPSARRARVLWVGIDDPSGGMSSLAAALDEVLDPLGFPLEERPFAAHLTIARLKAPVDARAWIDVAPRSLRFEVGRVTLYRSRLGRPAPRYEVLSAHELA